MLHSCEKLVAYLFPSHTKALSNQLRLRILVSFSFFASLVCFLAAVFYDFIRLEVQRYFVESISLVALKTTPNSHASKILLFAESTFFAVTVLAVLPITEGYGKKFKLKSAMSNYFHTVLCILRTVAWILWTSSAIIFLMGVLFGVKLVGFISFSALLALFAQGIGALGLLLSDNYCDSNDDFGYSSSSCTHKTDQVVEDCGKCRDKTAPTPDIGTLFSGSQLSISLDVGIFCVVSTLLLQSPYYLHLLFDWMLNYSLDHFPSRFCVGQDATSDSIVAIPLEVNASMIFVSTIGVPLFTHGAGGEFFVGKRRGWCFHHPFEGGKLHVTAQAIGWSLLSLAGVLQMSFLLLGLQNQYSYLLHSGSILSGIAQILLFVSLLIFRPKSQIMKTDRLTRGLQNVEDSIACRLLWYLLSFVQDIIMTNMHWFYVFWIASAICGFNPFSLNPLAKLFKLSIADAVADTVLVLTTWVLWTIIVPCSPKRKVWKWNIFGIMNDYFLRFLCHPKGLFSDSRLVYEETTEAYKQPRLMFAMAPHGTLPTSVLVLWHQFEHIFANVCLFVASHLFLVPGYRYILAMRGGCLPINKESLLQVMHTGQSVALIPGGISEMMNCHPHSATINVSKKHYGFVRLAIQQGYHLVPTFFFHANDQYDNPMKDFQLLTYKYFRIPVGLPWYTNRWRFPISNRNPVRFALGRVIKVTQCSNPSEEMIKKVHKEFYDEVYRIFEKHKHDFQYGNRSISFVTGP